ncbi:unnamed protein product, partial [Phaeothamnion confervicola]
VHARDGLHRHRLYDIPELSAAVDVIKFLDETVAEHDGLFSGTSGSAVSKGDDGNGGGGRCGGVSGGVGGGGCGGISVPRSAGICGRAGSGVGPVGAFHWSPGAPNLPPAAAAVAAAGLLSSHLGGAGGGGKGADGSKTGGGGSGYGGSFVGPGKAGPDVTPLGYGPLGPDDDGVDPWPGFTRTFEGSDKNVPTIVYHTRRDSGEPRRSPKAGNLNAALFPATPGGPRLIGLAQIIVINDCRHQLGPSFLERTVPYLFRLRRGHAKGGGGGSSGCDGGGGNVMAGGFSLGGVRIGGDGGEVGAGLVEKGAALLWRGSLYGGGGGGGRGGGGSA